MYHRARLWIPTPITCPVYSQCINCNRPYRPHILHHPDKFLSHESSYGLAFSACSDLWFLQQHSHTQPLTHQHILHPIPHLSWVLAVSNSTRRFAERSMTAKMLKWLHLRFSHFTSAQTLSKIAFSKKSKNSKAFCYSILLLWEHRATGGNFYYISASKKLQENSYFTNLQLDKSAIPRKTAISLCFWRVPFPERLSFALQWFFTTERWVVSAPKSHISWVKCELCVQRLQK